MILIRTAEELVRALESPFEPKLVERLTVHWDRLTLRFEAGDEWWLKRERTLC